MFFKAVHKVSPTHGPLWWKLFGRAWSVCVLCIRLCGNLIFVHSSDKVLVINSELDLQMSPGCEDTWVGLVLTATNLME